MCSAPAYGWYAGADIKRAVREAQCRELAAAGPDRWRWTAADGAQPVG